MTARNLPRPALIALAVATIGGAGLLLWRHRSAKRDDSIEPRHMPGSAADIHVAGGTPVIRP